MPRSSKKNTPVTSDTADALHTWQKQAAGAFKALSDPTRLRIFHTLRAASESLPESSLTVGQICEQLLDGGAGSIKDPSTISHHLKELRQAGLITMERDGQHRRCRVNADALAELANYLCPAPPTPTLQPLRLTDVIKAGDAPAPTSKTRRTTKP